MVKEDRGEVVGGDLVSEQAKASLVLPLREAVAHFARRDTRSAETEVGGSDYGNAHSSFDVSTNLRVRFLPLLGKQAGQFLEQSFSFFAQESVRRDHERRKVSTLIEASLEILLLLLTFVGC